MKKRIALLIAILLALGLLCSAALAARMERYANADQYIAGDFDYRAADVQRVEIHWIAGSVTLSQSSADTLRASEIASGVSGELQMRHLLLDGVLYIQFCQAGTQYSSLFSTPQKALTVEIPAGIALSVETRSADIRLGKHQLTDVTLQSTSGGIQAEHLIAEQLSAASTSGSLDIAAADALHGMTLHSTSGSIQAGGLRADTLTVNTTSGGVHAQALAAGTRIQAESTSGSINLEQLQSPALEIETTSGSIAVGLRGSEKADIRSTSGSVQLALHNNLGATVDYRSTSGSFRCDDCRTVNDQITLGDGACKLRVRTTSGNLEITQP